MKTKQITYRKEKEKEKDECPICLQKIKKKNIIQTECSHRFCDICIVKHLMIKNTCPMCRTVCDYEYITDQISSKRQGFMMRKLIQPVTENNIHIMREPVQPINVYARFIHQQLPASIIMIVFLLFEVSIITYLINNIGKLVINIMLSK